MRNLVYDPPFLNPEQVTHSKKIPELFYTLLLFGSAGAIAWAIRGTSGWGGVDGTLVPGLMWGLLWWIIWSCQGLDARHVAVWLGLGIALGGELGYGQYVSWILGTFYLGNETMHISPVTGYIWFFICGMGWAAPGGIVLGWALGGKSPAGRWVVRSLWMIVLLLILFAWPLVDTLALWLAQTWPGLLFPHAGMGIYSGSLDHHLSRTIYTNTQNALVIVWLIGALLFALLQKDRTTLITGLVLSVGFGFGFMISAAWCLGYGFAPGYIDWWKMWELNAGFFLGMLYAVVMVWASRHARTIKESGDPVLQMPLRKSGPRVFTSTLFQALAGAILIFLAGFEYFFWTGLFLAVFFFFAIMFTLIGKRQREDKESIFNRQKNVMVIYAWFLLWFMLFHGGSERAGIFLGLYGEQAVDQYAWPAERILLFAPVATFLFLIAVYRMRKILQHNTSSIEILFSPRVAVYRLYAILGGLVFIGALSIWPAKISVFYALFVWLGIIASAHLEYSSD
jgi:hypothetical protein